MVIGDLSPLIKIYNSTVRILAPRSTYVMQAFSILLCLIGLLITVGLVGASDEVALLQLKQEFGSPSRLSSWNTTISGSPCSGAWIGVTCGISNQSVTGLILRRFNFKGGTLSSAIGDLPNLEHIDLSDNGLTGQIPAVINKLPSLRHLDLSNNAFTGSLPEIWNNLTLLANLTLTGNQLTGSIPRGLIDARGLIRLRLENNQLSGTIPPGILDRESPVPRLRYFAIEHNDITGPIPAEVGRCVSLRSLYAAGNRLSGSLPESIGRLTNLRNFRVEGNELSGALPDSMDNLTDSLITFNVSNNMLSGRIPAGLSTHFNDSSFVGNPLLCGSPLSIICSNTAQGGPPPPAAYTRRDQTPPMQDGRPYYTENNRNPSRGASGQKGKIIGGVIGGIVGAILLICLLVFVTCWRWKLHSSSSRQQARGSAQVQNWFSPDIQAYRKQGKYEIFQRGFHYSYEEIVSNAGYFDTAHVVGKGRFATVYRSRLPDRTLMAVKVFKFANVPPNFEKQIEMLASINHRHVLSVKGYYTNPVEKAILFNYLPTGSLYDVLHRQTDEPAQRSVRLDWSARYTIALGVAQAMAYLHTGCGYMILHRDLKSSNILLEKDLTPKVSDHGLIQMISGRPGDVVETEGYTAPEVLTSRKYTEKSDVYSYGVILMELVTGKKAVSYEEERPKSLASWVTRLHEERRTREMMDAVALDTCSAPEYIDKTLDLACLCVNADPNNRPSMASIVSVLQRFSFCASPLRSPELRVEMPLLPSNSYNKLGR